MAGSSRAPRRCRRRFPDNSGEHGHGLRLHRPARPHARLPHHRPPAPQPPAAARHARRRRLRRLRRTSGGTSRSAASATPIATSTSRSPAPRCASGRPGWLPRAWLAKPALSVGSVQDMDDWVLWLIAAVVFGVGEIATLELLPRAVRRRRAGRGHRGRARCRRDRKLGGVPRRLADPARALRPIARAHMRQAPRLRTGTAALVGQHRDGARADR